MIRYSTFRNVADRQTIMHSAPSWSAFADYLEGQAKRPGIDKLKTLCVSPAIYPAGATRAKRNVEGWQWFGADIDAKPGADIQPTIEGVAEKMFAQECPFVIYTTSSHTPEYHRLRLMFPLDRMVMADEHAEVWASVAQWFGCLDPATKDESRLFVAPRLWPGDPLFFRHDAGEPVCVDLIKMAHPVAIPVRASRKLTSAFLDTSGMKTPDFTQVSLHGDFVTPQSLGTAMSGEKGTRMFPFLVRTGLRALHKGFAITADDLASIGREFASSVGRDTSDVDHDAENAHQSAVSLYAQHKATRVEKLDPVGARIAGWRV